MYNVLLRHIRATIFAVAKQKSIKYSECVFVALGIQHTLSMCYIVICGLSSSAVFFHIIS